MLREPVNSKEYLYNKIRNDIINLTYKPGDAISEAGLAKQLGVSRTPIREVFIRLAHEKLINIYPQKGTYISLIDLNFVKQIIFMRFVLEKEIMKEACDHLSEEAINELKVICGFQKAIAENKGDTVEFLKLDNSFHRVIFEDLNREVVWEILEKNNAHYSRFRLLDIYEKIPMEKIVKQHTKLIELLEKRDNEKLVELLEKHLHQGIEENEPLIGKYSEYFTE